MVHGRNAALNKARCGQIAQKKRPKTSRKQMHMLKRDKTAGAIKIQVGDDEIARWRGQTYDTNSEVAAQRTKPKHALARQDKGDCNSARVEQRLAHRQQRSQPQKKQASPKDDGKDKCTGRLSIRQLLAERKRTRQVQAQAKAFDAESLQGSVLAPAGSSPVDRIAPRASKKFQPRTSQMTK
eukprot:TRINITY_DN53348_c0_g1_i1.p1 TRINITY_DN53348_c0_g1~~TRINITY_DN53348_c0_g1_i1.p1  ORF type:complete len:182 (+),score=36.44 TRINITY_DN53348_c0_g1_i1:29-574(+)